MNVFDFKKKKNRTFLSEKQKEQSRTVYEEIRV